MPEGTQKYRAGPTLVALARGYFAQHGLQVEAVESGGRRHSIPLLAQDKLDVTLQGPSLEFFRSWNPTRPYLMVADHGSTPAGDGEARGGGIVARPELIESGRLRDYPDLRGLRIGLSPLRGDHDWLSFEAALRRGGLTFSDVEVVECDFGPGRREALKKGTVDLATMGRLQHVIEGRETGAFVVWKFDTELQAGRQGRTVVLAYRFWSERPEEARRYVQAYLHALRDYHTAFAYGIQRGAMIELLAEQSGESPDNLERDMLPVQLNPDGYVNVEDVARQLQWLASEALLPQPIPVERVVDHSYLEDALREMGRYHPPAH